MAFGTSAIRAIKREKSGFYVRERENPEEGEAPIELVIGISGAEKMAFTPMVVLRSSSERVLDDVYKIVDYSRLTHATTAGPDAAVFVASRNPNEIHPLEVSGQFPDGCHIYGAPQILVRPDASLIIIPQEAISAQAPIDLNNPAITPGMAR